MPRFFPGLFCVIMFVFVLMKSLEKISPAKLKGKIALVRIDLNVAFERPEDVYRLDAVLPTLRLLLARGAKVVLLGHKGRPTAVPENQLIKGTYKVSKKNAAFSLKPFVNVLAKKMKTPVKFFSHFDFEKIRWEIATGKEKIFLLENVRFFADEEKNDEKFARSLASLGDFYVNDAFAVSHRKHASVFAITKHLPAYAGVCLTREVCFLKRIIHTTKHPFVVLLGGAKAKDKLSILKNFWSRADMFLLGGGPANTFLAAHGEQIGKSIYDKDSIPFVERFAGSEKIYLPLDDEVYQKKILDIGPQTADEYARILVHAQMIFWNGTMGYYHDKKFANGTKKIWEAILKNKKALVVVGGGETIAALDLLKKKPADVSRAQKNIFLSTGGGALLEFLSGKKLPGLQALGLQ